MVETLTRIRGILARKSGAAGGLMITVGVLGLLAMGAATAWAGDTPRQADDAMPAVSRFVTQSSPTLQGSFTDRVREMVEDHMGLTGQEADAWASEMAEHMQDVHGEDTQAMLDSHDEYWDGNSNDDTSGWGPGSMMDGYQGDGYGPGSMMGGSGFGGMMGD